MKIPLNFLLTLVLSVAAFICIGGRSASNIPFGIRQDDAAFLVKAAVGDMMEVELGQLAQINSLEPVVKDIGSKMVRDHGQHADRIKALATAKNIAIPATLSDDQQKIKEGLQKKTGAEFDKEYIDLLIDDHKRSIREFEKEATGGSDKEIKAFADSSLQMMHAHLDAAENYKKTTIKN